MNIHKLLITGAQGQLGQALQAQFVDLEVVAWDMQELDISYLEHVRKALNHRSEEHTSELQSH